MGQASSKVRFGVGSPRSMARAGTSGIVKGFRMPARRRREGRHGGRRPKSHEGGNRGGSSHRRWCQAMEILAPVFELIFDFRSRETAERVP